MLTSIRQGSRFIPYGKLFPWINREKNLTMIFRKYITAKELAVYLSVKVKTIYSWVEAGKIPAYKLNGALRFNLQEINEFRSEERRVGKECRSRWSPYH